MKLTEDLLKAALLGTEKHAFTHSESNPQQSLESQLLLEVGGITLRAWAGYIPNIDPRPLLTPGFHEITTLCGESAMYDLRLMISGIHNYALHEWLVTAIRSGRHVQEDVLPKLLLIGQKRVELRPFLLPVIGERGLWLAAEITNQNWNWVLETSQYNIDDVIAYEQLQETNIILQLQQKSLENLRQEYTQWMKYRMIWTNELTEAFMSNLERVKPPQWSGYWWGNYIIRGLVQFAYFFPLEKVDEIVSRIHSAPAFGDADAKEFIEPIRVISNFRRSMIEAIQATK